LPSGIDNISVPPSFLDVAAGNFRLDSNSACINSGFTAFASAGGDLDDRPRVVGGIVDMGAYEFQAPGVASFIAWLQQYGLSTDGSADYADCDGDLANNWQEWIAGTDPTNFHSALRLLSPTITPLGVLLKWTTIENQSYSLERGVSLNPASFIILQTNLTSLSGGVSYTDTNAPTQGAAFYRVLVNGTGTSFLPVLQAPAFAPPATTIRWTSVSNRTYFVERSVSMDDRPIFSPIATNIPGLVGTTIFVDTNMPASDRAFYRVGVKQ